MKPFPDKLLGHIQLKFASVSTKLSPWVPHRGEYFEFWE